MKCTIDGCQSKVFAKRMCCAHYQRVRKYGITELPSKSSDIERFMSYVEIDEKTGAWLWKGGISNTGYGGFWVSGKTITAHRYAYEMRYGAIPEGMMVCHKYEELGRHNVNPDHLFLGTQEENNKDAANKDRTASGENNGQSRLTEAQVAEIRTSTDTYANLALRHHVSTTIISKIKRGTAWMREQNAPAGEVQTHSLRNKSGYRGVCRKNGAWEASITVTTPEEKKTIYIGRYQDPAEAARAYDKAALEYRGDAAKLNFSVR